MMSESKPGAQPDSPVQSGASLAENPKVTLSPKALEQLKKKLREVPTACGIRLAVKKTGCSGYQYDMQLIEQSDSQDIEYVFADGVKLFIEVVVIQKYFPQGLDIDYVREGLNHKFTFHNPVAKDLCGCGESFRT